MAENAIEINSVTKKFRVPHEKYSTLKQRALNSFRRKSFTTFTSVEDINLEIRKGEFFGIVGRNGSGKSTLLKMIAGIYMPTSGTLVVRGKLSPFIELGVGFNPELSGRENIFLSGTILGMRRKEIEQKFEEIVDFAEMKEFIDQKLKNYSSGMQVRLAFSIAIRAKSDIMLVDEVLAVGDVSFQKKCFNEFKALKKEGRTIVFVSHDMESIVEFCDRVAVISDSKLIANTDPLSAKQIYNRLNAMNDTKEAKRTIQTSRRGKGTAKIVGVEFLNEEQAPISILESGKKMGISIHTKGKGSQKIKVGIAIYSQDGINISGPNTGTKDFFSGETVVFTVPRCPLKEGTYLLTVGLFDAQTDEALDYIDKGFAFSVVSKEKHAGEIVLFGSWDKNG